MTLHAKASSARCYRSLALLSFAVLALVLGLSSTQAFACPGPLENSVLPAPQFEPQLREPKAYATRAHVLAEVQTDEVKLEWHGEYSTSESGPWRPGGSGVTLNPIAEVFLGSEESGESAPSEIAIHHLEPKEKYFVCFHAKSAHGEAEKLYKFETTPSTKPEVVRPGGLQEVKELGIEGVQTSIPSPSTSCSPPGLTTSGFVDGVVRPGGLQEVEGL